MCILLAGDIATNPGPFNKNKTQFETLHCLSFNAQSLRSLKRLDDGSVLSNLVEGDRVGQGLSSVMTGRLNNSNIAKLVEKRREAGDNSQKVREATEEVREAGDVYPTVPPPN